jgi:ribosomal protein S18 acetylase RimI-like enzyme
MFEVMISPATGNEKEWAASLMAKSEPWTTLGVGIDQCLRACSEEENHLYIAHNNGEPVGLIILRDHGVAGSPYIKSIAVETTHRNKGIGKQLLKFAEEKYRQDARFIFLCVSSFNRKAQEFYLENNYTLIGEFKDYIVEGHSELLMQKRLR